MPSRTVSALGGEMSNLAFGGPTTRSKVIGSTDDGKKPRPQEDTAPVAKDKKGKRGKKGGATLTNSKKAGLQFPVGRIRRFLKQGRYTPRIGGIPPCVYLTAVLEYLVEDVLKRAGKYAATGRSGRIKPLHLMQAMGLIHEDVLWYKKSKKDKAKGSDQETNSGVYIRRPVVGEHKDVSESVKKVLEGQSIDEQRKEMEKHRRTRDSNEILMADLLGMPVPAVEAGAVHDGILVGGVSSSRSGQPISIGIELIAKDTKKAPLTPEEKLYRNAKRRLKSEFKRTRNDKVLARDAQKKMKKLEEIIGVGKGYKPPYRGFKLPEMKTLEREQKDLEPRVVTTKHGATHTTYKY